MVPTRTEDEKRKMASKNIRLEIARKKKGTTRTNVDTTGATRYD
jgi:hypothetical protein